VSEYHGNLYYYKNTGTNDNPIYTQQTYDSSPFRNIQLQNFLIEIVIEFAMILTRH
jgi:hypothetical protein